MTLIGFFTLINQYTALPATIIFFGVAIILTIKTKFIQLRSGRHFFRLLCYGFQEIDKNEIHAKTISPFHALFTAMGTTIGVGNLVAPAIAVYSGGPGALFWMLIYIFFGSVTKFTEVCFAIESRVSMADGTVIGGPMRYLAYITPGLGTWYMCTVAFLSLNWSALQSNTLALIYAQEGVSKLFIGISLAIIMLLVLRGGAERVGIIASRLVPIMFVLYFVFALFILMSDLDAVSQALYLIFSTAFSPKSVVSGIAGAGMLHAMRAGIYRGIFITEAGLGTSSIPHAVTDAKKPTDQAVLAMYSMISDAFLSMLSGVLVLVTGVWAQGNFRSTFIYEAFKLNAPISGDIILLIAISLFVITTVIGNTFNGMQNFALFTRNRFMYAYLLVTFVAICIGSVADVTFMWEYLDTLLTLVAVPHILGLLYLAFKKPEVIR
jgi:AGCS family alanine or glycine:cation symporter